MDIDLLFMLESLRRKYLLYRDDAGYGLANEVELMVIDTRTVVFFLGNIIDGEIRVLVQNDKLYMYSGVQHPPFAISPSCTS